MRKLLLRKNFQRTFAFLLTLVIVTGIAGMGFTAEARTSTFFNTFRYVDGNRIPFGDIGFQIRVNGSMFINDRTFNQTHNRGRRVINRTTIPNGSNISISVEVPDGYQIHEIIVWMNAPRVLEVSNPSESTFDVIATGEPWLNNLEIIVIFKSIIPTVPIGVLLDGAPVEFDVLPQVTDGRTLVPLRAIFEALGAEVSWNAETQTVTGTKGGTTVVLPIGSTSPTVNGQVVNIDVPGTVVNGRTLVPLRFVAESFGVHVNWDAEARQVTITS